MMSSYCDDKNNKLAGGMPAKNNKPTLTRRSRDFARDDESSSAATTTTINSSNRNRNRKPRLLLLNCLLALCLINALAPTTLNLLPVNFALALDNGLARTPPAGWVAWQRFTCNTDINEYPDKVIGQRLHESMGLALRDKGFLAHGYDYLNIDDCWNERERGLNGSLVANSTLFPDGIQALAKKIHALEAPAERQLLPEYLVDSEETVLNRAKLGIYGDCGLKTCAGYPGLLITDASLRDDVRNYMEQDSKTFVNWQIDSYKMDGCYVSWQTAEALCARMGPLLAREAPSSRQILITCEWPFYMGYAHIEPNYTLVAETCNMWRFYDDIEGPGHWFDPDQLVIGNNGLSRNQAEAQMALWAAWSAPLMMGNDVRDLSQEDTQILLNKRLIKINRDPLGVWALKVAQVDTDEGSLQAFVKPVTPIDAQTGCPSFAVLYFNRRVLGREWRLSFELRSLLLKAPVYAAANNQRQLSEQERFGQARIDGLSCLEALKHNDSLKFAIEDATRNTTGPSEPIAITQQLALEVEPSGVRMVKLTWL